MTLARKIMLSTVIGMNSLWGQGEAKANLSKRDQANIATTISREAKIEQLFLKREKEAIELQRQSDFRMKLIEELRQLLENKKEIREIEYEIKVKEQMIQKLQGINETKIPVWFGILGATVVGSLLLLLSFEIKNHIELKKIIKEASTTVEKKSSD